jgi:hypothetical protein
MTRFASHASRYAVALAIALFATPALAGPPFVNDDPEPTEQGHWEIYNFATGSHTPGVTDGEAGIDLNYGAAKDLQLTAVFPAAFEQTSAGTTVTGGVIELAAKYKFLHQTGPTGLDVAAFPRLFVPTHGDARTNLFLPVWAQKDYGHWSAFGGGGYDINPGPGQRNYWLGGIGVSRQVSERLMLGVEAYHRGADSLGGKAYTALNVGGAWKATEHWSILASTGPGIENARSEGQYGFYLALKADY